MSDPALRAALFRFVDVRPACATPADVTRHLHELLAEARRVRATPAAPTSITGRKLATRPVAAIAATGVKQMAQRFIVGADAKDSLPTITGAVEATASTTTVDLLGEATVSEAEADRYMQRCEDALRALAAAATKTRPRGQPVASRSPRSRRCCAPRRPSAGSRAPDRACATCCASPATSARTCTSTWSPSTRARRSPRLTLDLLSQPEFADGPSAGIVLQAYLVESPEHLDELLAWAASTPRAHPFTIRLVKGAYWDHEVVQAAQHGWAPPVFTDRRECDRNFELLTKRLIDATPTVQRRDRQPQPALDLRTPPPTPTPAASATSDLEFQILRGLGDDTQAAIAATGRRVRAYCPVGDLVAGMAYLVRRLLENTANDSFLAAARQRHRHRRAPGGPMTPSRNEPLLELRREAVRREALDALARARRQAPARGPDADRRGRRHRPQASPPSTRARPTRIVAHAHEATAQHVEDAVGRAPSSGHRRVVARARRRPRRRALARRRHPALAPPGARRARRPRGRQAVGRGRRRRLRGDRLPRVLRAGRARARRAARRCSSCRASATRCATSPAASPA